MARNVMSKQPTVRIDARVTNIRSRLTGAALITLSLLVVGAILYFNAFSRLESTVNRMENQLAQAGGLTAEQEAEIDAAHQSVRAITIVWGSLIAAAVAGSTLITMRSIANPLEKLSAAVNRIAGGELEERVEVEWAGEFGQLATAFNEMGDRLQASYVELEQRVEERTHDLQQRTLQLSAAAEVAREAAMIRDVQQLLSTTVRLISDRFGFYHAGIFLLDEAQEYAVLQAASSEGGQHMLERGHRLKVGEQGIVGYVSGTGNPRIALDVGDEAIHFDNPDLPLTRSEMALPLTVHERIIGVLDVQSLEPEAFSSEDIATLQILTDQLALAIENARLFSESRQAIQDLQALYKRQTHEVWSERAAHQRSAYLYTGAEVEPVSLLSIHEKQLPSLHQPTVLDEKESRRILAPIRLRGEVLGAITLQQDLEQEPWSGDELALLQEVTNQIGLALENARLLEETQARAAREQLIGNVVTRIREALDVDTVLQTAIREIGQSLNLSEVEVRLYDETTPVEES